jgi:O-antigen biosynthesis protein
LFPKNIMITLSSSSSFSYPSQARPIAVRTLELTQPLAAVGDLEDYAAVRVFPTWQNIPIGYFQISHNFQSEVSVDVLSEAIQKLDWEPLLPLSPLDRQISVSIVIATCDRPEALQNCLQALEAQVTQRYVEIVVVDNRPQSGLTAAVVAAFPQVKYVVETRQGASYARNAGILASSGEIIATTDDDVVISPDWLERLIAPFIRPEVMAVTGNILPLELDTLAQQSFEAYDRGLGRGFRRFERDWGWCARSWPIPQTWKLGMTANAAFRATIFHQPQIGLMCEALGPGTASGAGEDCYLFYRILKAQGLIVYEPSAYVWHQHRREMPQLQQQIYAYGKSCTAYLLVVGFADADWRALWLPFTLPFHYIARSFLWLVRRRQYPIRLIAYSIVGNIMGVWGLWQAWRNVRLWGRSREGHHR